MAGLSLQGRFPAARGKGAPQASLLPPPAAWGAPKAVKFRLEPFGAPPSTCEPPSYALPPSSLLPVRCMWFLPGPAPVAGGLKKEWEMCPSVGRTAIGAPKGRRRERRKTAAVSFPAGPWLAGRSVGRRQLDIDPPRLPPPLSISLSGLSPPLLLFWHACLTE